MNPPRGVLVWAFACRPYARATAYPRHLFEDPGMPPIMLADGDLALANLLMPDEVVVRRPRVRLLVRGADDAVARDIIVDAPPQQHITCAHLAREIMRVAGDALQALHCLYYEPATDAVAVRARSQQRKTVVCGFSQCFVDLYNERAEDKEPEDFPRADFPHAWAVPDMGPSIFFYNTDEHPPVWNDACVVLRARAGGVPVSIKMFAPARRCGTCCARRRAAQYSQSSGRTRARLCTHTASLRRG